MKLHPTTEEIHYQRTIISKRLNRDEVGRYAEALRKHSKFIAREAVRPRPVAQFLRDLAMACDGDAYPNLYLGSDLEIYELDPSHIGYSWAKRGEWDDDSTDHAMTREEAYEQIEATIRGER